MAMSRRDYEAFARLLNRAWRDVQGNVEQETLVVRITGDVAAVLRMFGNNFDANRFTQACFRLD